MFVKFLSGVTSLTNELRMHRDITVLRITTGKSRVFLSRKRHERVMKSSIMENPGQM